MQQSKNFTWDAAWRALVELDFIANFFTWLMKLLAIITEPVASISAIYIIIVAGVPALLNAHLYTFALALIIGSPELLVVGAFKIASHEIGQGNKKGWWLMGSCFILLLLTALTVGDLFMWHWGQTAVNVLMGFRCLAGIIYSFTRGIVTDRAGSFYSGAQVHKTLEEIASDILAEVKSVNQQTLAQAQVKLEEIAGILAEVRSVNQQTLSDVRYLLREASQHQQQQMTLLGSQLCQEIHTEITDAIAVLGQHSSAMLDEAVARLERANSRRLEAVYTKIEQVAVTLESNPSLPAIQAPSPRQQFQRIAGRTPTPVRVAPVEVSEVTENGQSADTETSDNIDWRQLIADKLSEFPFASSQQMADAVGCSRSTAGKWLKILREERVAAHAAS